jgi:ABC-type glutathione transport system ATPase component
MGLTRKEIESRFDEIVEFSELERFIGTPLKRYSSGMAVRLGFAVAACINPDILLVDEVLAVGDTSFRLKCMKRIEDLIKAGTTLIFVSHNMGLVKAVCESAIYIDEGQVKYFGKTSEAVEVYNRSLNEQRLQKFKSSGLESDVEEGTVDISKVEVVGLNSTTDGVLHPDQGAKVAVHYFAYRDIGPVSMVTRIVRSDGLWCCVMYSSVDEFQLSLVRGEGVVSITIDPLQLYPGKYGVAVTLKNAAESLAYDFVLSDWFQVVGNSKDVVDRDAVFEPNRKWDHRRVEPQIVSRNELSS